MMLHLIIIATVAVGAVIGGWALGMVILGKPEDDARLRALRERDERCGKLPDLSKVIRVTYTKEKQ